MSHERPSFTVGIEEEYFIVDRSTRDLVPDHPDWLIPSLEEIIEVQVSPEFIRSQIEIGTPVSANIAEVGDHLRAMRKEISNVVADHGMAIISASTHPFATWEHQRHTDKERYNVLARALQGVIRRLLICGMHVHVGIENRDLRIDLMNQVLYFLPHLLALSTSSPFWQGTDTGLHSYRTSVFRAVPRTGMPDEFAGWGEYQRHVEVLVQAGVIEDASRLWWDVRPSARYPTVEMRATDICTRVEDGVTIAALFLSLLAMLYRIKEDNQRWRIYSRMLINENTWRAQRYGITSSLIDFGKGELVPIADLVEELIDLVREDAVALGCLEEVEHIREIVRRGTSADRQLAAHAAALEDGAGPEEALVAVVDHLIEETVVGL